MCKNVKKIKRTSKEVKLMKKLETDNIEGLLKNEEFKIEINDEYGRSKAWEYCHKCFIDNLNETNKLPNIDSVALHLFNFLGNWGMFRNSKLLNKNYTIMKELVVSLFTFKDIYDNKPIISENTNLTNPDVKKYIERIIIMYNNIKEWLDSKGISPTDTLITKIMLGTYGCVPAFDSQFKQSYKKYLGIKISGSKDIETIYRLYYENKNILDTANKEINNKLLKSKKSDYPIMKILDLLMWKLGE